MHLALSEAPVPSHLLQLSGSIQTAFHHPRAAAWPKAGEAFDAMFMKGISRDVHPRSTSMRQDIQAEYGGMNRMLLT